MAKNTPGKRPVTKTFIFNLGVIVGICFVLYWLFFSSLGCLTHHGEAIAVPNLKGLSLSQAEELIKANKLTLEVDSTFQPDLKPLSVVVQNPEPGFKVKSGHTILLTVNRAKPPMVDMPSLINLSYRSAVMILSNNKLLLGDTIMRPDMAEGAVLDQLLNGKHIDPGTSIPQGTQITLVIGNGLGKTEMEVPDVIGLSYQEAVALLSGSNLNFSVGYDGDITDTANAMVTAQDPSATDSSHNHNFIKENQVIHFTIKQGGGTTPDDD